MTTDNLETYNRTPPPPEDLPYECGFCDRRTACPVERDWGGFCNVCGVSLPDQDSSPVVEELQRVAETAQRELPRVAGRLIAPLAVYGLIFIGLTALLLLMPGNNFLLAGTPATLANLIWLTVGGALFFGLALAHAGVFGDSEEE